MTGWDWDHIEETMTIPRLLALEQEWKKTPPLAVSMAVVAQSKGMKIEGKKKKASKGAAVDMANALKGFQ